MPPATTLTADRPARPVRAAKSASPVPAGDGSLDLRPTEDRGAAIMAAWERFDAADAVFQDAESADQARRDSAPDEDARRATRREPPQPEFYISAYLFLQSIVAGPIPRKFIGGFLAAATAFASALAHHLCMTQRPFDQWPAGGKHGLFQSRDVVRHAVAQLDVAARPRNKLESVHELAVVQKVPHEQVARMWGLVWASGEGKAHLIQQELDNPGSVIAADYIPPVERDRELETVRQSVSGFEISVATQQLSAWADSLGYKFE